MPECEAWEWRAENQEAAEEFPDDELCRIADVQVKRTKNMGAALGASQREYDRQIRREIRRRGLDWEPKSA